MTKTKQNKNIQKYFYIYGKITSKMKKMKSYITIIKREKNRFILKMNRI